MLADWKDEDFNTGMLCLLINPSDLRYFCEKCQKYPSFKHVLKRTGVD